MTDNHAYILRMEGLKELLMNSYKVVKKMSQRLYAYRNSPTADQREADKRDKELNTIRIALEEATMIVSMSEQEIMRLFVLWQEEKKNSKFYCEAWRGNLNENIELTQLLIKKIKKKDG